MRHILFLVTSLLWIPVCAWTRKVCLAPGGRHLLWLDKKACVATGRGHLVDGQGRLCGPRLGSLFAVGQGRKVV